MVTKHFLKTLLLFTLMIGLGLGLVFVVSYFDDGDANNPLKVSNIAK